MEHSAWPVAIWLELWMWKQQEQSALATPIFVLIRHLLGMAAQSGFHTGASPMEMTAALWAASGCRNRNRSPITFLITSLLKVSLGVFQVQRGRSR